MPLKLQTSRAEVPKMSCEQISPQMRQNREKYKKLLELRRIRGYSILAKGDTPTIINEETFFVPSQSDEGKKYKVTHFETWECECLDFRKRNLACKHIQSIELFLKLRSSQESEFLQFTDGVAQNKVVCPCGSAEVVKRGTYRTTTEVKQRYKCKACKRRFCPDLVKRTKVNGQMITLIMDLYYKGLSLRDIKGTIKTFYGVSLHHETIRQYVLRFTEKINAYTDKLKPKVSDRLQLDEQKLKTKSEKEWKWCWNVIDEKTRFLLANNITNERSIFEAKIVLDKVKPLIKKPVVITTDKLKSYNHAIATILPKATHLSGVGLMSQHNNNTVERYHNQEREFDKIRRGFDRVEEWQAGHRLFHNFIRGETTPAMKAGINVAEGENNRWLTLLKKSYFKN